MNDRSASRKHLYIVALLVIAAAAVFALWPASTDRESPGVVDNTLHRGIGAAPESLDYHKTRSVPASTIFRDIGEGLMTYSASGELVTAAAASWPETEDGLVYTFRLHADNRWSNGEPLTADDFVFSYQRLVDPATGAVSSESIEAVLNAKAIIAGELPPAELGVRAIDDLTLEITLEQPTPYFLSLLTHPSMFPLYRLAIETHGDAHTEPGTLVTNGPYRVVAIQTAALVELERNTHYRDAAATAIDRVHYHVLVEPMSEYNRYRAGELHITSTVPPDIFATVKAQYPDELRTAANLGVYYFGLNVTREPFADNLALRQALSMAIDRDVLVDKIVGRGEKPAYSFVPPGIAGYEPPKLPYHSMTRQERNAQARRLYAEAGYSRDNPLKFELRYNTSEEHQRYALAISSMWQDVLGVEVELIGEEFQVFLANIKAHKATQAFRGGWNGPYNDPHAFLSIYESGAEWNSSGWASKEYDSLMARAASQRDPATRMRYLEEAERELLANHPLIPLYYYVSKHLVSPEVEGWEDNILDYHYSHHLSLRAAGN